MSLCLEGGDEESESEDQKEEVGKMHFYSMRWINSFSGQFSRNNQWI